MSGHLICIGGLPGSGKTTVADQLTEIMNECASQKAGVCVSLCPDKLRLQILGRNPETDILTDDDITEDSTHRVIVLMKEQAENHLSEGSAVIIGSSFIIENMRKEYQTAAENLKANFTGIWLEASAGIRRERANLRLEGHNNTSAIVSDRVLMAEIGGQVVWSKIDAERPVDDVVADVFAVVKSSCTYAPVVI